jgi:hypothetical protein
MTDAEFARLETLRGGLAARLLALAEDVLEKGMGRYDPAIRAWARHDRKVAAAVAQVDRRRVKALAGFFEEGGFGAAEARIRARTFYTFLLGEPQVARAGARGGRAAENGEDPRRMKLPASRTEVRKLQSEGKRAAVERAIRSPFWKKRIPQLDLAKLDDPEVWRRIPILDKDTLRALSDEQFYGEFCHASTTASPSTGARAASPASRSSTRAASETSRLASSLRAHLRLRRGRPRRARAHLLPAGHPPGRQIYLRCATSRGITVNWAGAARRPLRPCSSS